MEGIIYAFFKREGRVNVWTGLVGSSSHVTILFPVLLVEGRTEEP